MPSFSVTCPHDGPIQRAIKAALDSDRFTVLEMAEVCSCSERMVERAAAGQAQLGSDKVRALAVWLCRHGETRLSQVFLCSGHAVVRRHIGTADGDGRAELVSGVKALSGADDSIENGDKPALRIQIDALRQVVANLEAEHDQLL